MKNENMSSQQRTVCECNHLTHFAILLSARPVAITSERVQLSLNIISYIGVSVSLVAMAILVFIFKCFRKPRNVNTLFYEYVTIIHMYINNYIVFI